MPPDVAAAVRAVHEVPAAFAARFGAQPCTVVHADAAHVNIGFEERQVTLLDWALATWGPPALELVPYLTASASSVDVSREEILASYRVAAGAGYDDDAVHLALVPRSRRARVEQGAGHHRERGPRWCASASGRTSTGGSPRPAGTIELGLLDGVVV